MRRGDGAGETEDGGERKPDACAIGDRLQVERLVILTMIFEIKSALGLFGLYLALHTALRVELSVNSHFKLIESTTQFFVFQKCLQYHSQIIDPQVLMKTNSILPSLITVPFK